MILNNLFARITLNCHIFLHCKEISNLYKTSTLQQCLEALNTNKYAQRLKVSEEVSATYLSKRIKLINRFLGADNCLANSMCLFLAIRNRKNVSFIIGVSDDFKESAFSHCWVEIGNVSINEKREIMKYKPVISIHR